MPTNRRQPLVFAAPSGSEAVQQAEQDDAPAAIVSETLEFPARRLKLSAPTVKFSSQPWGIPLAVSLVWSAGVAGVAIAAPDLLAPLGAHRLAAGAVIVLLACPLVFVWAAAFLIAESRALSFENRRAREAAEEMAGPALRSAAKIGSVIAAVEAQLAEAMSAAEKAAERLAALDAGLSDQTEHLIAAAADAEARSGKMVANLAGERAEMGAAAAMLEARAAAVTEAMHRQAAVVGEASDLAEAQLAEAQASLAARSADLALAAARASEASRTAADDLGRQTSRLEIAQVGVGDQLRALEEGLTDQRAALVTLSYGLRADQEEFASLAETRAAQLSALISSTAKEAEGLNASAVHASKMVGQIVDKAAERFEGLSRAIETKKWDVESLSAEATRAFEAAAGDIERAFEAAAANRRQALSEEIARSGEALNAAIEAAATAAQAHAKETEGRIAALRKAARESEGVADQALDARLAQARAVIGESARLVSEAGEGTANRLDEAFGGVGQALADLKALAEEALAAAARMPAEAEEKGRLAAAGLEAAMEQLLASARKTAEETTAIDEAFQARVKRNYEMLSEAVQLMGVVAQAGQERPTLKRSRPSPAPVIVEEAEAGLRPKLKLIAPPAEAAHGDHEANGRDEAPPKAAGGWKAARAHSENGVETPPAGEAGSPFNEIASMGIDPAALLTRGRIEEIAAAVQRGDGAGVRETVRTFAPAATRRLSRRMVSDAEFGAKTQAFVVRYSGAIEAAVKADPDGYQAASLLASDQGRAFLLLDASRLGEI